jgi:hypothetical protein
MNEVLPLLALPSLVAFAMWQRRERRTAHRDLRAAIEAHGGAPVTDAGPASLLAVARSLTLDPADVPPSPPRPVTRCPEAEAVWETGEIIRPLGLEIVEVVRVEEPGAGDPPLIHGKTEIRGMRHGRMVVVRLREASTEVVIQAQVPEFELRAAPDGWVNVCDAPPEVREVLESLLPNRRWHGLCVTAGAGVLRLHRAHDSARSWMHDLWLAELLTSHALLASETLA